MKQILFVLSAILLFCSCRKTDQSNTAKGPVSVLILGNSITYAPANPAAGWPGSWGMAASALEKDYVHLLAAKLKATNPASTIAFNNIAEFERNFDTYNFDNLKSFRDAKPDILILRIGENVTRSGTADSTLFDQKYVELINYFKATNPQIKILAVGSVWPQRDMATAAMIKHTNFISLLSLQNDLSNFAIGLFTDPGIQVHPSDKGMQTICDIIWPELNKML